MDAKFFASPPLEWFVDSKTLESCLLGSNIFDKTISLIDLDTCRDIHCEIVNVDGKLVFGVMVAPNNFVEATTCKLFEEDALMLMLFAAVARYDVKKLIRNVDMNMYKIVEDMVRTTDMLANNYSNSNFCKVGSYADVAGVKGTNILKLSDGKFIDCRNVPGIYCEKTVDTKVTDVHEFKLVYMRDKNMYDIYAVIGVNAYQIGKIHAYEKIYDDAMASFGKTKIESKQPPKLEKRWKKDDIKKLITPICELPKDELKEFITPDMKGSDISCTIEIIDPKNERALISFTNEERIIVSIPGVIASTKAKTDMLNNHICTAKPYIAADKYVYLWVGDKDYYINISSYFDLFGVILCLETNHYIKHVARDIVNAKFEFPTAPSDIFVNTTDYTFTYSGKSTSIILDPGTEILNLLQLANKVKRSNVKMPNIKWFVAKNDDQHYLAVGVNGVVSTTYKLTKDYANLIHVWLNLCD